MSNPFLNNRNYNKEIYNPFAIQSKTVDNNDNNIIKQGINNNENNNDNNDYGRINKIDNKNTDVLSAGKETNKNPFNSTNISNYNNINDSINLIKNNQNALIVNSNPYAGIWKNSDCVQKNNEIDIILNRGDQDKNTFKELDTNISSNNLSQENNLSFFNKIVQDNSKQGSNNFTSNCFINMNTDNLNSSINTQNSANILFSSNLDAKSTANNIYNNANETTNNFPNQEKYKNDNNCDNTINRDLNSCDQFRNFNQNKENNSNINTTELISNSNVNRNTEDLNTISTNINNDTNKDLSNKSSVNNNIENNIYLNSQTLTSLNKAFSFNISSNDNDNKIVLNSPNKNNTSAMNKNITPSYNFKNIKECVIVNRIQENLDNNTNDNNCNVKEINSIKQYVPIIQMQNNNSNNNNDNVSTISNNTSNFSFKNDNNIKNLHNNTFFKSILNNKEISINPIQFNVENDKNSNALANIDSNIMNIKQSKGKITDNSELIIKNNININNININNIIKLNNTNSKSFINNTENNNDYINNIRKNLQNFTPIDSYSADKKIADIEKILNKNEDDYINEYKYAHYNTDTNNNSTSSNSIQFCINVKLKELLSKRSFISHDTDYNDYNYNYNYNNSNNQNNDWCDKKIKYYINNKINETGKNLNFDDLIKENNNKKLQEKMGKKLCFQREKDILNQSYSPQFLRIVSNSINSNNAYSTYKAVNTYNINNNIASNSDNFDYIGIKVYCYFIKNNEKYILRKTISISNSNDFYFPKTYRNSILINNNYFIELKLTKKTSIRDIKEDVIDYLKDKTDISIKLKESSNNCNIKEEMKRNIKSNILRPSEFDLNEDDLFLIVVDFDDNKEMNQILLNDDSKSISEINNKNINLICFIGNLEDNNNNNNNIMILKKKQYHNSNDDESNNDEDINNNSKSKTVELEYDDEYIKNKTKEIDDEWQSFRKNIYKK